MRFFDPSSWNDFLACIGDLLETEQVQSMRTLPHHPRVNCYEHSVFVAYVAFRLGCRWNLDQRACARGGLLHDLYLYNSRDKSAHPGNQCLDHPGFALRNASALTRLSDLERNIILAHMWPLALHMPQSREAWTVSLADKLCATVEVLQLWRHLKLRTLLAA